MSRSLFLLLLLLVAGPASAQWIYGSGSYGSPQAACDSHVDYQGATIGASAVVYDPDAFYCEAPPGSGNILGTGYRTGEPDPEPDPPPNNCLAAGTPWLGGAWQTTKISGVGAPIPSQSCHGGCLWNEGPQPGDAVKMQDSSGQWWAGYKAPNKTSTGQTCPEEQAASPDSATEPDKVPPKCQPGYVPDADGVCRKTVQDQTGTATKTTETQNPDGTTTRKETSTTTTCGQASCISVTTETVTNYHSGTGAGISGPTTTTTTTTQPKGDATPPPGTSQATGSSTGFSGSGSTGGSSGSGSTGGTSGSGSGSTGGTSGSGATGGSTGSGSPNGGTAGGSGTSDGSGYCEEVPNSPLCSGDDHCKKYPETLACLLKGDPGMLSEEPLHNETKDVSSIAPSGTFGGSSSTSCPAGTTINVAGVSLTFSFDLICQFASMINPLIIGFAWLSAAFTFFGFARKD